MTQPTDYVLAGHESKVYKLNRGLLFETGFKTIEFQIPSSSVQYVHIENKENCITVK